jgi:hypothetical protein
MTSNCLTSILLIFFCLSASALEKPENLPEDGVLIERANGDWLHLTVATHRAVIAFYDKDGEAMKPDVAFGVFRFQRPGRAREQLSLYREGDHLFTPRQLSPPHIFRGTILLFREGETTASETHGFEYRPAEN